MLRDLGGLVTLVKVCGIRDVAEGRAALAAGADWLGFVLWPESRRAIAAEAAAAIIQTLRAEQPAWSAVGVFVNPTPGEARRAASLANLDYVQLSGDETAATVRQMPRPVVKAVHVRRGGEAEAAHLVRSDALGAAVYLLDTHAEGLYGGTGATFDWPALRDVGQKCLVAGGLRPDNVPAVLATLGPRGVDVSSGVEYRDGGKDPRLVRAFLDAVRTHDEIARSSRDAIATSRTRGSED